MPQSIWVPDGDAWRIRFPGDATRRAIELFVEDVTRNCSTDHSDLRTMCDWAYRLGCDELATLVATRSGTWPVIRLIPAGSRTALAAINHANTNPHTFLKVWRSVCEHVAPQSIARLEAVLGPLGNGRETRQLSRAALRSLRAAFREARTRSAASTEGWSRTQSVTAKDVESGRIRLPRDTERLFPDRRCAVEVILRGERLVSRYNPRSATHKKRSAVLSIEKRTLARLVEPDEVLRVARDHTGGVRLD